MDSSTSHQSEALTYLLNKVSPENLRDPTERLLALKAKLKVLFSWVPDTPGFQPYGLKVYGLETKYQKGISGKTKIMVLSQVDSIYRPTVNLLVTTEGQLLIESRRKGATPDASDVIAVARCSDDRAAGFLSDTWVLIHACEAINRAIERRIKKLYRELDTAMRIQCQMGGTILPRTL